MTRLSRHNGGAASSGRAKTRIRRLPDGGHSLELRRDLDVVHHQVDEGPDHIVDSNEMVADTELMFLGVSMHTGADEFKPPAVSGWRFVTATRQPFGAACIYERVVDLGADLAPLPGEPTGSEIRIQKVCQTE